MELLELHEGSAARAGSCTCSPRPTRSASTPWRNWSNSASPGSGWAWNRRSSGYAKLEGADTLALTRELRSTASACSARPSSAWSTTRRRTSHAEIEHAVAHDTDFHQFMLYTPVPGTPLYAQMKERGHAASTSIWPTSTASTSSTSSTRSSPATIRRSSWTGPSGATSSATVRASTASAAPRSKA